jgi:hypothetical protein
MTPIISGVVSWLKAKLPSAKAFPAPNDGLSVRVGTDQYEIYFITNADEAFTAAFNIGQRPLLHPATTRRGVILADSAATAADPQVQSAIESNHSGDAATYLGYLQLHEVKKWPSTAP